MRRGLGQSSLVVGASHHAGQNSTCLGRGGSLRNIEIFGMTQTDLLVSVLDVRLWGLKRVRRLNVSRVSEIQHVEVSILV